MTTPELICAVCLYVRHRPDLDEDQLSETEILTVKGGILVCVRHISCVGDPGLVLHHAIKGAVQMESKGQLASLSEYQDWRYRQIPGVTDAPSGEAP
jgi:hypothetical protein